MTKTLTRRTLLGIAGGDEALADVLANTLARPGHETATTTPLLPPAATPTRGSGLHFFSPPCGETRGRLAVAGRRRTT